MAKQTASNRNKNRDKILSILSILLVLSSWFLGGLRVNNSQSQFFEHITAKDEKIVEITPQLFKIIPKNTTDTNLIKWVSFGSGIGYGGELTVGSVFLPNGEVQSISLLSSKETSSYFDKIVEEKLPEGLLDNSIEHLLEYDAISGATLTSQAYVHAVNQSADLIREQLYGTRLVSESSILDYLKWLDFAAVIFFMSAVWINRSRSAYKAKFNVGLLLGSTVLFGFHSASLYSSSTMGGLVFGSWISGVANYTPFILLILSVGYILYYNRNIYCQSLCPFGAVQQCLAKVGNAKSSPIRHQFFIWFPRVLLLTTLCMGAYFRSPAEFIYEPFGIAFGMIGGMYLFVLTVMILLTSLVVRRPWCQSLCPINAMTDFIVFNKNWAKQVRNNATKKRKTAKKEKGE
ncbi:4Fe-4S binding protein [Aliivibrio finisterrensis]|uniref:FMN-binding protein n=1 Tax=Aliivibrio finisterrensis TaxID=511998 RepID=UPI0010208012|nr:4Fe-4S binding protein [Aliivibrio finisterrensis]RYU67762.1 4Fe-4S binding protein [Aliivibrio finisterrensis]RYU74055.1 4Fe-4S binding protein [Aliivibrio finisterrensis]